MVMSVAFGGSGGQGIVFAAEVLAETLFEHGLYVSQLQSYGAEVRGGSVLAYVVLDDKPIENPFIESFSIAVVLHRAVVARWRKHFENSSVLVVDSDLVGSELPNAVRLPIARKAMENGVGGAENVVAVGIALRLLPIEVPKDVVLRVLSKRRNFEINARALELGLSLGEEAKNMVARSTE